MPPFNASFRFHPSSFLRHVAGWLPVLSLVVAVAMPTIGLAQKKKNHMEWKSGVEWTEPAKVEPGESGSAPSDAVVLFDGTNLDQWINGDQWKIEDGVATVAGATIVSKQKFGSCQLHLEFSSPEGEEGKRGQGKGNSGVFFGNGYEVQVLDSYENKTYFDGQCGALYKQQPPLVNPTKAPGQWQTYDIIYEAPRFGSYGEVVRPVYLTVLLNGVLIQNHVALKGRTLYNAPPTYEPHAEKMPISLQWHKNPVRYRNIWIRELDPPQPGTHPETPKWATGDASSEEKDDAAE